MPLTFSITVGIGAAFVSYVVIKIVLRQAARGPSAAVGRRDRVRHLLPAELDQRRSSDPPRPGLAGISPAARPSAPATGRRGRRRAASCTIRGDVRTDRAARGAARHQRPAARGTFGLHRRVRPGRFAPGIRRGGRRRPTSWSTSRSRARRPTRRRGPSARPSRASAARSTRPPTASRPSTGSACRGARRPGRWTSSASSSSGPSLEDARDRRRAHGHRRGDPLLPGRSGRVRPDPVPDRALRRRSARARDLRRRGRHPRAARGDDPRRSGATMYRPVQHGHRRRRRHRPRRRRWSSPPPPSGPATASSRASSRRRPCRPATASASASARRRRRSWSSGLPGAPPRPSRRWTLAVLNAVLGDGMSSRLFLSVREERGLAYDIGSGLVDYADAGALEISAGVDPAGLPRGAPRILDELVRLRDELVPDDELGKAKRYLAGGLELRMDETRHVASWIGGQEALHDRVLTLDEALAAIDAVTADDIQRVAARPHRRRRPAHGGGRAGSLPPRPRAAPAPAGMTDDGLLAGRVADRAARPGGRPAPGAPAPAPRLARAGPGRARDDGRRDMLDDDGLVDLAEVRWRTGDLDGAGEAAAAVVRDDDGPALALIIAAEAAHGSRTSDGGAQVRDRRMHDGAGGHLMPCSPGCRAPPSGHRRPIAPVPSTRDDVRQPPRHRCARWRRAPRRRRAIRRGDAGTPDRTRRTLCGRHARPRRPADQPHAGPARRVARPRSPGRAADPERRPDGAIAIRRRRGRSTSVAVQAPGRRRRARSRRSRASRIRARPAPRPGARADGHRSPRSTAIEPGLALVRGDAYRLVGRESDARATYAAAARRAGPAEADRSRRPRPRRRTGPDGSDPRPESDLDPQGDHA